MMFGWFRRAPAVPTQQLLRMTQALAGYPPYTPPEWKPEPNSESMRAASAQYREYFLASFPDRLEALRALLTKFDVALSVDDSGLMAVSTWLPDWGDLLVNDFGDEAVGDAYHNCEFPWTGARIGLNVIFDLGIYYAECLWARRTKLQWLVTRGADVHGYLASHHFILGLPGGKWMDPFYYTYLHCQNIRQSKINKQRRLPHSADPWHLKADSFSRHVLADAPPGRRGRKSAP